LASQGDAVVLRTIPKHPDGRNIAIRSATVYQDQIVDVLGTVGQLGRLEFAVWVDRDIYSEPTFTGSDPRDICSTEVPAKITRLKVRLDAERPTGTDLDWRDRSARMVIDLYSDYSKIHIRDAREAALYGHASTIKEVLERYRRISPKNVLTLTFFALFFGAAAVASVTAPSGTSPESSPLIQVEGLAEWALVSASGFLLAFLVFGLIGLWLSRERGGSISIQNVPSSTRTKFFARTRDDWIVEVVVATVFLVIGIAIGRWFPDN
jgi:hypothetical protein